MSDTEYAHNYAIASIGAMVTEFKKDLIGVPDAKDEWRTNRSEAEAKFINIDSYNEFADPSSLFLVGRIGTGKTAILNRLQYSIQQGQNNDYQSVVLIDANNYIAQLSSKMRFSGVTEYSYTEIENIAIHEWIKTLNTIAMKTLYDSYMETQKARLSAIKAYLLNQKLLNASMDARRILEQLTENLKSSESFLGKTASLLTAIASENVGDYNSALLELENELSSTKNRMLILVDSVERYEFHDRIVLAVLNAMVDACMYFNDDEKGIAVKMALPSELVPNLLSINLEKTINKMVYIRWNQSDLKALIAVRLYKYVANIDGTVSIGTALEFFDNYYEQFCNTTQNFKFPTFAYCMSYTQKKPRQLISIFNTWLNLEKKFPHKNRMSMVSDAIAQHELIRVQGAFTIYSSVHPNMFDMFKKTFANQKYCFSENEFDKWLKACASIRGSIDAYDLKRYFVASGLVGIMVELHTIEKNKSPFNNDRVIRIKEVLFEYQYKERLPFNNRTKFCLHPMCYRVLSTIVDLNTFVYPKPLEIENEYVPWAAN